GRTRGLDGIAAAGGETAEQGDDGKHRHHVGEQVAEAARERVIPRLLAGAVDGGPNGAHERRLDVQLGGVQGAGRPLAQVSVFGAGAAALEMPLEQRIAAGEAIVFDGGACLGASLMFCEVHALPPRRMLPKRFVPSTWWYSSSMRLRARKSATLMAEIPMWVIWLISSSDSS